MTKLGTRHLTAIGAFIVCLLSFQSANASVLPANNLDQEDNVYSIANMTETEFNETIDEVARAYFPIVSSHQAELKIIASWKSSVVNAGASQSNNTWRILFHGGLARRPEISRDAFALAVCHELGHHLAGFPFYEQSWASDEGQSDYFATQTCVKGIWANDSQKNADAALIVDSTAKAQCDSNFADRGQRELCYRISNASYQLALLLSRIGGSQTKEPSFQESDSSVVAETQHGHPEAQCRLDTFTKGILCPAQFNPNLIPGKDISQGRESVESEKEAAGQSCTQFSGYQKGLRPLCWYKPRI